MTPKCGDEKCIYANYIFKTTNQSPLNVNLDNFLYI